jgi:capsular exopolysaccharide synthesis family protein
MRGLIRVLREQWFVAVIGALVVGAGTAAVTLTHSKVYRAQSSISFNDIAAEANLVSETPVTPSASTLVDAAIEARTITRPAVVARVKKLLNSNAPTSGVSASVAGPANLVVIRADASRAASAAALANAYATAEQDVVTAAIQGQLAQAANTLQADFQNLRKVVPDPSTAATYGDRITRLRFLAETARPVQILGAATAPAGPVSPHPIRNGLIGLAAGLLLGLLIALLRGSLDRRLRDASAIGAELGWPIVGKVRDDAMGRAGLVGRNGRGPTSGEDFEDFRIVRRNVQFLNAAEPPRSIVVTSALADEGKSTVAASLACAGAAAGKLTLLVECDLRRPSVSSRTGLQQAPGLADYLAGDAEPGDVLQSLELPSALSDRGADETRVVVITAGSPTSHPAELLGSERFRSFVAEVTDAYDMVVLDSPPMLSVADTREVLTEAQSVLVCVRAGKTTTDQARALKDAISQLPSRPVGVVVTGVRPGSETDFDYYSAASRLA